MFTKYTQFKSILIIKKGEVMKLGKKKNTHFINLYKKITYKLKLTLFKRRIYLLFSFEFLISLKKQMTF